MPLRIRFAAAFVVSPTRGQDAGGRAIRGSVVVIDPEIQQRLEKLFDQELKSKIKIKFVGAPRQENAIRDHVRSIARDREPLEAARQLARELGRAMDTRSARSLLLVLGERPLNGRVAVELLKFPHDNSLSAEEEHGQLVLKLLDRAFTAESVNFKAATFADDPAAATGFWKGQVEDRQARLAGGQVANYWIEKFLRAELLATSDTASSAVADALKDLLRDVSGGDAVALTSAAQVMAKLPPRRITFDNVAERYIPPALREGFLERVRRDYGFDGDTTFELDGQVLEERFGFQVIMLQNQVSVSAPAATFADLVNVTRHRNEQVDIRTSGRYAGMKLRRRAV